MKQTMSVRPRLLHSPQYCHRLEKLQGSQSTAGPETFSLFSCMLIIPSKSNIIAENRKSISNFPFIAAKGDCPQSKGSCLVFDAEELQ
ncbi:hypothetical protein TrispH2_003525 [Trichoplax sp. H2]|nr:hypothetical protein TrispH2_003525 [Trichoplax sp. H2]|eukprot:RDD45524.1 hypothetical protein TrispH2_003525 [Trichoplax sp. H2]